MAKPMTALIAIEHLADLSKTAARMESIITDERHSHNLRYDAAVTQDHVLSLMKRYIDHIDTLKGIKSDYDWTNIYRNNTKDR